MGVLFALDGWVGSTRNEELQRTARLRNFKYAIATAFLAFIADLTKLGITVAKDRLLLCYVEGFVCTSVAIISIVALGIWMRFRTVRREHPEIEVSSNFSPVLSYVIFGFSYYKTEFQKLLERISKDELAAYRNFIKGFLPAYINQFCQSIAAIDFYLASHSEAARAQVAKQILQSIRAVVIEYYSEKRYLRVNVNYMLAQLYETALPPVKERVRFAESNSAVYEHLLVLKEYAEDEGREDFALAVPGRNRGATERHVAPGAPEAFFRGTTTILDDTGKIAFPKGFDRGSAEHIKQYFSTKGFKSFASINIIHGGERLGVVNVESNQPFVFGKTEENKKEVEALVKPFCLLLGFVIKGPEIA